MRRLPADGDDILIRFRSLERPQQHRRFREAALINPGQEDEEEGRDI